MEREEKVRKEREERERTRGDFTTIRMKTDFDKMLRLELERKWKADANRKRIGNNFSRCVSRFSGVAAKLYFANIHSLKFSFAKAIYVKFCWEFGFQILTWMADCS